MSLQQKSSQLSLQCSKSYFTSKSEKQFKVDQQLTEIDFFHIVTSAVEAVLKKNPFSILSDLLCSSQKFKQTMNSTQLLREILSLQMNDKWNQIVREKIKKLKLTEDQLVQFIESVRIIKNILLCLEPSYFLRRLEDQLKENSGQILSNRISEQRIENTLKLDCGSELNSKSINEKDSIVSVENKTHSSLLYNLDLSSIQPINFNELEEVNRQQSAMMKSFLQMWLIDHEEHQKTQKLDGTLYTKLTDQLRENSKKNIYDIVYDLMKRHKSDESENSLQKYEQLLSLSDKSMKESGIMSIGRAFDQKCMNLSLAIKLLKPHFSDSDKEVIKTAQECFDSIANNYRIDPKIVEELLKIPKDDPDSSYKCLVISMLMKTVQSKKVSSQLALKLIEPYLIDSHIDVKKQSIKTLIKIAETQTVDPLKAIDMLLVLRSDANGSVRGCGAEAMWKIAKAYYFSLEETIVMFKPCLADTQNSVEVQMYTGFCEMVAFNHNIQSLEKLKIFGRYLKDSDSTIRRLSVLAISKIAIKLKLDSQFAIQMIRICQKDSDHQVRRSVIWAISRISQQQVKLSSQTIQVYEHFLTDTDNSIRRSAIWAMFRIVQKQNSYTKSLIRLIKSCIRDSDRSIRRQSVQNLADITDSQNIDLHEGIQLVKAYLQDDDDFVRQSGLKALKKFTKNQKNVLNKIMALIQPYFKDDSYIVRRQAVQVLLKIVQREEIDTEKILKLLNTQFQDQDRYVRCLTNSVLSKIASKNKIKSGMLLNYMKPYITDINVLVRESAVSVLQKFAKNHKSDLLSALKFFQPLMEDSESMVRRKVAEVFCQISKLKSVDHEEVIEKIEPLLNDSDLFTKRSAIETLKHITLKKGFNFRMTKNYFISMSQSNNDSLIRRICSQALKEIEKKQKDEYSSIFKESYS